MLFAAAAFLALSACASADVRAPLVTPAMAVPGGAKDTKGDGILRDANGRPVSHPFLGQKIAAFSGPKADGGAYDGASMAGRWTVLVAWGLWCHDSRNDMDNISAVAAFAEGRPDVDFISVHVPYSTDELDSLYRGHGSVAAFFEAEGISFPTVLDETAELRAKLWVQWTPTYLLIGPDLTVEGFRTDISVSGEGALDAFLAEISVLAASR